MFRSQPVRSTIGDIVHLFPSTFDPRRVQFGLWQNCRQKHEVSPQRAPYLRISCVPFGDIGGREPGEVGLGVYGSQCRPVCRARGSPPRRSTRQMTGRHRCRVRRNHEGRVTPGYRVTANRAERARAMADAIERTEGELSDGPRAGDVASGSCEQRLIIVLFTLYTQAGRERW